MPESHERPGLRRFGRRPYLALAAAGLLAAGGAVGAIGVAATRPSVTMAPATPVAIRSLSSNGIVTVRGRVAEEFGNKFILADASGRALIDTGREGENGDLVKPGEAVTVQGRFDRGFIHAAFLVGPDGKVAALGPLNGPPHGHRHGPPPHDDGPDGPRGASPAPGGAPVATPPGGPAPDGPDGPA